LVALWQRVRDAAQLAAAEGGFLHHRAIHALLCAPKKGSRSARQRRSARRRASTPRSRTGVVWVEVHGHRRRARALRERGGRERESLSAMTAQRAGRFDASLWMWRTHLDGARQQVHRRCVLRSVAAAAVRRKDVNRGRL
jgi:hypothetical protein